MARKRYQLRGTFTFKDGEGVLHTLDTGTELGPKTLACFSRAEIAIHIREGRFVEIIEPRQGLAARARAIVIGTN